MAEGRKLEFTEDLMADAVITIMRNESCEDAIQSILTNASWFMSLHIVKHSYNEKEILYPKWEADLALLEKAGLPPIWHSIFEPSKCKAHAIIHVSPEHTFNRDALTQLYTDLHQDVWRCTRFAVSSVTNLTTTPSLAYGFVLVWMVIDALFSLLTLFQHHRTTDLRALTLHRRFPAYKEEEATRPWAWWIFTGIDWRRNGHGNVKLNVRDGSWSFLFRYTANMHTPFIWLLLYVVLYFVVAFKWWQYYPFLEAIKHPVVAFGLLTLVLYLVWTALIVFLLMDTLELPSGVGRVALFFLFPVFYSISPILLVVAKIPFLRNIFLKK